MLGDGNMLTYLCFKKYPYKEVNEKGGGPDTSKVTVLSNIKFVMSTPVTLGYSGIFLVEPVVSTADIVFIQSGPCPYSVDFSF